MDEVASILMMHNVSGFKVRSKADARLFLKEIVISGEKAFADHNDPKMYYIINKSKGVSQASGMACIAHERRGKSIWTPDLMHSGEDAVEMAWQARRSINAELLSADD